MARDLRPEDVLASMRKGQLAPFYLFHGPEGFRLERMLDRIRTFLIPESARDFNLEIFYGGETDAAEITHRARSLPFLAQNRLILVRRKGHDYNIRCIVEDMIFLYKGPLPIIPQGDLHRREQVSTLSLGNNKHPP